MTSSGTFDDIADAIGHPDRRELLAGVLEANPVSISEHIGASAAGGPSPKSSADLPAGRGEDVEAKRIGLHHTHLPKLESSGYVEWNRDEGTVVKGPNWAEIKPVLELLRDNEHDLPVEWP